MKSSKFLFLLFGVLAVAWGLYQKNSQIGEALDKDRSSTKVVSTPSKGLVKETKSNESSERGDASKVEQELSPQELINNQNNDELLRLIDKNEVAVDAKNEAGMEIILMALEANQVDLTYALLDRGADILAKDDRGNSVLTYATLLGEEKLVRRALKAGASPREELDNIGSSLLMYASQEGLIGPTKALVEAGAKVDKQNKQGDTALIWAVKMGQVATTRYLLDAGANVELENNEGLRAIDYARQRELNSLVNLLNSAE